MKKIALMGLMAAVVAVGLYSCSGGADTATDTIVDSGTDGGSDAGILVNCGPSPTGKGGEMCDVPAGLFMMGCNTLVDTECRSEEFPYHAVVLPAYRIDKYDVAMSEYQDCVTAGSCTHHFDDGTCRVELEVEGVLQPKFRELKKPVVCVDWNQARTFCQWVGKRLPTEAEWEKSARGRDGRKYPWGDDSFDCDHAVMSANMCHNSGTAPVGSKPLGVSPFGAEDMIGNVWQWVEDDYHSTYTGAPTDGSAWVDSPRSPYRVTRGGGWNYASTNVFRISLRGHNFDPMASTYSLGFRCAMSVP